MLEIVNNLRKDYVFEQYTRIVVNFKDYEKTSRKQMIESIYKIYDDYENILDICTTRELKFLEKVLNKKIEENILSNEQCRWEINNLHDKFLLQFDHTNNGVFIPDEIKDKVKEAIKNVDWTITKNKDEINEVLIGYCKVQGSVLLKAFLSFVTNISDMDEEFFYYHIYNNKLFRYYVYLFTEDISGIGEDIEVGIYQDYFYLKEELDMARKKQGIAGSFPINIEQYKTIFYNDFDINNKKIKRLLNEVNKIPILKYLGVDLIKEYALLNMDRNQLKEKISSFYSLRDHDLTEFFNILDEAMDEMPSGALNGFTPNQAKEINLESKKLKIQKEKSYVKQQNACLDKKDAKLFYKIYLALLDYTNQLYKIKKNLKIHKQQDINPLEIMDIVEKFWENKEEVITEFCLANPYKFNDEEINLTNDFKKGIRGVYILAKYEKEYTAFLNEDKAYMVKGINCNIDNLISYKKLPIALITTILPFKNVLVYDSLISEFNIQMGNEFEKMALNEYSKLMKYYHL